MNSELKQDLSGITPEMVFEAVKAFRLDKEPREAMYDALAAALAVKSSAAQEAVAWQRRWADADGLWFSISKEIYEATQNGKWADRYEVRALYAAPAPVTAAPADAEEDACVIDQMGKLLAEIAVIVNGPEPAGTRWSYHDLPAKVQALASTPAAPGIDLEPFRRLVEWNYDSEFSAYENGFRTEEQREVAEAERKRLLALIDASPKGDDVAGKLRLLLDERNHRTDGDLKTLAARCLHLSRGDRDLIAMRGALIEKLQQRIAKDSPKGGSDALDATRLDWLDANGFTAYRQIDPIDGLSPHCVVVHETQLPRRGNVHDTIRGAIDAAMQAQAGDAEVQP